MNFRRTAAADSGQFPLYMFLIYVIFYSGHAFYNTYTTLFLYQNGLTQAQIGIVNAIFTTILIFLKPLSGVLSDKSKNKARMIGLLLIANAAVCLAFYISAMALWLALCVILYQLVFQPVYTMQESYTIELMEKSRWDYGNIRLGGTLGYVAGALISGIVIGDDYGKIFWIMAIVYGVAGVLQLFARPIAGQRKQKEKVKYSVVFHHAPLMCLIGFQLMSSLGSSFGSYYSIYFRYTLGAPSELLSWMTVVGALSELPFFWYANRIERRIGTQNFMTIAVSATVLKMILLSFVTNPYIVLLLQVLGGMSVVGNSYSILKYINDVVPKQMRTTAMMVNAIVVTIFSSVVCSPLVGVLDAQLGTQTVLVVGAAVSISAVILFSAFFPVAVSHQQKKEAMLKAAMGENIIPAEE